MRLKIKGYNLSPKDKLPDSITDPEELIKNNCAIMLVRMLVKTKKYAGKIDNLENPYVYIDDKKRSMILLGYNQFTMIAPEVFLKKKGPSVPKILEIMESINIPIIECTPIAKDISSDCKLFEPIPEKYYGIFVSCFPAVYKKKVIR